MYTASSTGLRQLIPDSAREEDSDQFRERIADPVQKQAIARQMVESLGKSGRSDYQYAVIASYRGDPNLNGLRVPEAAKRRFGSDGLDAQIDMILEIESKGGAAAVFHGMDEEDVRAFISHPNTMFASDSSVREFEAGVGPARNELTQLGGNVANPCWFKRIISPAPTIDRGDLPSSIHVAV